MNDTYISFPRGGYSRNEVLQAIKEVGKLGLSSTAHSDFSEQWKKDPMAEHQNSSPTIREFLKLTDEFGDRIRYIGYMIVPPRSDYRVTIEGFRGIGLSSDEALDLMSRYDADERNYGSGDDGKHWVRFWWD